MRYNLSTLKVIYSRIIGQSFTLYLFGYDYFTASLKHQLYRLLMLICMPVAAVILVTLWFSRDAAIKEHEKKVRSITEHLIIKQQSMINDVEHITEFLAKKQKDIKSLSSRCPSYF